MGSTQAEPFGVSWHLPRDQQGSCGLCTCSGVYQAPMSARLGPRPHLGGGRSPGLGPCLSLLVVTMPKFT